ELVERAAAESRSRAERLAQIVEATSDNIIIAGADARIRYLNQAGRAMLGVAPDEDLSGVTLFDFVPPAHVDESRAAMGTLVEQGVWAGALVLQRKDGSTFPVA